MVSADWVHALSFACTSDISLNVGQFCLLAVSVSVVTGLLSVRLDFVEVFLFEVFLFLGLVAHQYR